MRISTILPALLLTLLCAFPTGAQTAGPNPGVTPVRQIDRAEARVTRVELQPGAVRSVHQHDDVRFHLFIPITGKIELTIGSAKPLEATPGQAYFMQRGTPHGFRNIGSSPPRSWRFLSRMMQPLSKPQAGSQAVTMGEPCAGRGPQCRHGHATHTNTSRD